MLREVRTHRTATAMTRSLLPTGQPASRHGSRRDSTTVETPSASCRMSEHTMVRLSDATKASIRPCRHRNVALFLDRLPKG